MRNNQRCLLRSSVPDVLNERIGLRFNRRINLCGFLEHCYRFCRVPRLMICGGKHEARLRVFRTSFDMGFKYRNKFVVAIAGNIGRGDASVQHLISGDNRENELIGESVPPHLYCGGCIENEGLRICWSEVECLFVELEALVVVAPREGIRCHLEKNGLFGRRESVRLLKNGSRCVIHAVRVEEKTQEKRKTRIKRRSFALQRHLLCRGLKELPLCFDVYLFYLRYLHCALEKLLPRFLRAVRTIHNRFLEIFEILQDTFRMRRETLEKRAVCRKRVRVHEPGYSPDKGYSGKCRDWKCSSGYHHVGEEPLRIRSCAEARSNKC